jgi:hypothetical protein
MLRRVFERLSRNRVLKRRLPSDFGSRPIYVSPDAALRFSRYDLKRNADRRSFEHPRLSLNNPLSSREFSTQSRIEKFEESYGRTSGLCYYSRTESAKIPFHGGGVEV